MATRKVTIAAHYNVDANVVKVQLVLTDDCDSLLHPEDVLSGTIQLFNVFTTPETGLQEIPLEAVSFDKSDANEDGFFIIFFINPAININLEARTVLELSSLGTVNVLTTVLPDEGTFSDQPSTSVVGNAVNRSWHLDLEKERDEPRIDENPHTPAEPSVNDAIILDPSANSLNVDIQFEQLSELKSSGRLEGTLVYLGGGNRLLPKPGSLIFQEIDTPPWELGASTFVEQGAPELLPNNTYLQLATGSGFPAGYNIIDSPGISVVVNNIQTLQGEGFDAKAWSLQVNGAVPTSISPFNTASIGNVTPIPIDPLKPVALSLLAGMEKNTDDTTISDAKLFLTFYDFADRELTSKVKVLSVDDLFNARPLKPFSVEAAVADYPPTTEKVTWKLQIGSVEQGDFVTIRTAVPSLAQTPFATSQILSEAIRTKDNLSFSPTTPYDLTTGAAVVSMAIGFDVAPTETKYIFDTRDPSSLDKGVALRVEPDGNLTLLIQDDTTTTSLSTTVAPAWVSGAITEIVAEWSLTSPLLRISFNGATVAEDTSSALPMNLANFNISTIQLGSDVSIGSHIDSEFIRAVFLKAPR